MVEYKAMYLKHCIEVAREHRPSARTFSTHEILGIEDVKGAAIEASASLKEMPTSAVFKAPQSFAPSPHIPVKFPIS